MTIHKESHPKAGQEVKVQLKFRIASADAGATSFEDFVIEDWWDKLTGKSVWASDGNWSCAAYAFRAGSSVATPNEIPFDDEVVYGHVSKSGRGYLIHASEIVEEGERSS